MNDVPFPETFERVMTLLQPITLKTFKLYINILTHDYLYLNFSGITQIILYLPGAP